MTTWPSIKLGDVATIDRDGVAPSDIKDGTLYVGLEHIESGGRLLNKHSVSAGELASTKFRFTPDHLLYGKLRPYLAKIAMPDFHGICSTDILPILPGSKLDRAFLAYFLRQPYMVDYASSRSEGANLPRLSPKALAEFEVPLPPVREQRRIAAILDQCDELRQKRIYTIAKAQDVKQSLFHYSFGDSTMSSKKDSNFVRLGEIASRITDGVHQKPDYVEAGVPFISVKNITTGRLVFDDCKYISQADHDLFTKRCRAERGDILYTKVGATYGRPAIVDTDAAFSLYVSVCLIKPDKSLVDPQFLCAALGLPAVKAQADRRIKGIGVPDLHLDQIREFSIPLPSLADQREFSEKLRAVDDLLAVLHGSLSEFNSLFASLQHRAFTGKLTARQAERELEMAG